MTDRPEQISIRDKVWNTHGKSMRPSGKRMNVYSCNLRDPAVILLPGYIARVAPSAIAKAVLVIP